MNGLAGILDRLILLLPSELQAKAKESRKAIVGLIGALLTGLTLLTKFGFLVPAAYRAQIATAISVLTAALTFLTPNEV